MRFHVPAAVALSITFLATPAVAQAEPEWDDGPFSLRGEAGVGGMLPDYQRTTLGYGAVLTGALRPAMRLVGPLSLQASFETLLAPDVRGTGKQHTVGGGLVVAPRFPNDIRLVADANAGLALTGDDLRFAFNAGVGLEIGIEGPFGFGPFLRYSHTVAAAEDFPSDAMVLAGGVFLSVRTRGARRGPVLVDRDGDGVRDSRDVCIDLSAGDLPDPQRLGCPLGDGDDDGVADRDDLCPTSPAGDRPDPSRAGCPATDADGDGLYDDEDDCITTAAGETPDPDRPGCPDGDDDGDGVTNARDACRGQHQGVHPDPERAGCPLPDRDGDSIPDPLDHCADEAGAPHPDPERHGCPGLVRIEGRQIVILSPVFFATNRDRIRRRSQGVLTALADALRASPDIQRVSIQGHTDDVGPEERNLDLSRRRANTVMEWLVENGIEASRLEARGFGESRPVVPERTRAARAANRRVEFHVLERVGDPPAQETDQESDEEPAPTSETAPSEEGDATSASEEGPDA